MQLQDVENRGSNEKRSFVGYNSYQQPEIKENCESNVSLITFSTRELDLAETGQEIHRTKYNEIITDYLVIYQEEFPGNIKIHQCQREVGNMQGKQTGFLLKSIQKEEEAMNMDSENNRLRFEGLNRDQKMEPDI